MASSSLNLWIDSHVHLYSMYDIDSLLDSALRNFQLASQAHTAAQNKFILFITEGNKENAIERLQHHSKDKNWNIQSTGDYFIAERDNNQISLIPGQQLVSSEGLELLVIGGNAQAFLPKRPIKQLIADLGNQIAILPWGFGKWLGQRGTLIAELIEEPKTRNQLFIGDIPARLNYLGGKRQFALAQELAVPVLRGVDPLPLQDEQDRIASFGSCLQINNAGNQGDSLLKILLDCLSQIKNNDSSVTINQYGRYMPLVKNLQSQLRIRIKQ